MRWSAEKLRWVLLGGALVLAGVVAAVFGLASYRAGKVWQHILARNGVNLQRETDGYTFSQSDGKRTSFTLHAAKAIPHGNGNVTLHDAVLVLYTKDGRNDRIYGNQFEYDQNQGIARAIGEVHMDLEAPQTPGGSGHGAAKPDLSFTPGDEAAEDPALIHVRTSGLVYLRKLGVAATDQPAEFRYQGITCTSRGAEFDSEHNILRLLAEVHMTGTLRRAPFTLTATHADLDRSANTVDLIHPEIVSGQRNARAAHALLHLRRDGSIEAGDADGGVQLRSGTETVASPQMHGDFAEQNRPEHALLSGGVTFADRDPVRVAQGSARTADLQFAATGTLKTAVANGAVNLLVKNADASGAPLSRQLRAQTATASFVPQGADGKRSALQKLHMVGAAEFSGQSAARATGQPPALTRVDADDLTTTFDVSGRHPQPQGMAGVGHTQLQQTGADGAHQLTTGDALQVSFAQRLGSGSTANGETLEVSSAVQTGHVALRSWPAAKPGSGGNAPQNPSSLSNSSTGHAQQAVFEAAAGTLTLTGAGDARAEVNDSQTQLMAPTIVLHQGTGDGEASGGVVATTGGADGSPATHVVSERAALLHAANLSRFLGTDAQPARLWQGGSQVQAATIVLDGQHHTLSARPERHGGSVNAVFASAHSPEPNGGQPGTGVHGGTEHGRQGNRAGQGTQRTTRGTQALGGSVPEASRDTVEIRAAAMDYNDAEHEATFGGGVLLHGSQGTVAGDHGAAFLQPSSSSVASGKGARADTGQEPFATSTFGGHLERFAVLGDVRLNQPGRSGTGEQLTFTALTNNYVLTGTPASPPRIHDAQQGLVTGSTLLFGAGDSSIVVAGLQGADKKTAPARVHTETDLKQQ